MATVMATALLLMTGCGSADDNEQAADTTKSAEAATESTDETSATNADETTGETASEEDTTEPATDDLVTTPDVDITTTKGFIPLSQAIEFYEFEKEETEDSMFVYADSKYTGQYRLCSEAKDEITIDFDYDMSEGYIEVNGVKSTFNATAISNVAIIDIDKTDSYKEIAIYDEGPSADPNIILYRYCNGELYKLGQFGGRHDFDYILFDQQGRIIDAGGYIDFLDTQVVSSYYTIENNEAVSVPVDLSGALNQKYRVSRDIMVGHKESEDDFFDITDLLAISVGDEIELIEATPEEEEYYVELPDGRRVYITTHVAG